MKNAVIYARFSSHSQTEQSIDGQLRVCKEYAKRNNLCVVYEYIDRAISGTSDKRPAFLQMIKDANKKNFEYIICYKLDRFSRNQYDSVVYKHKLKEQGIKVISATESISDNTEGKLVECVLEIMAEMYSIDLSQKVKRGIKESIIKGKTFGGTVPLGYKQENKQIIIDKEKEPIIKYLFEEYANGKSLRQITDELNLMGYTNTKGQQIKINNLRQALKNTKYIGLYTYEDIVKTDYYPAIIDKQLFDIVQTRLVENKKAPAKAKAKIDYILTGKVFCGECGDSMYGTCGTSKQKIRYYYYTCKTRHTKHTCKKHNEYKDLLENEVIDALLEQILTPEQIENIVNGVMNSYSTNENTQKIKQYKKLIEKANNDLDKCFKMAFEYTTESMIKKADARAKDLEIQIKDYEKEITKLTMLEKIKPTKNELIKFFELFINQDKHDKQYQKKLISLFLNKVYVFDSKFLIYCNTDFECEEITFEQMQNDVKNHNVKIYDIPYSSYIKHSSPPLQTLYL